MSKLKNNQSYPDSVCVLGAGSSGLAAARNFRDMGVDVDVVEA